MTGRQRFFLKIIKIGFCKNFCAELQSNNICLLIRIDKYAVRLHDMVATNGNKFDKS